MEVTQQQARSESIWISEAAHVSQARRRLGQFLAGLKMKDTRAGAAEIILTEAAKNILKHARTGQIVLRYVDWEQEAGVEILAIDSGPGMVNPAKCMEDGYSTAGSPGTGMGAMRRLSDVFDLFTQPGKGTVVLAQLRGKAKPTGATQPTVAGISLPKTPGDACGDGWGVRKFGEKLQILVVDGLGHGILAAKAADTALRVFHEGHPSDACQTIQKMHLALKSTRGASLAIAEISPAEKMIRFTGVGNIAGVVAGTAGGCRSMVSHNGTVGYEIHRLRSFEYPWGADSNLIMHSDGIATRWDLAAYPGLLMKHPATLAGVLYRDWRRGSDDVTAVVVRM
jgi:anti-sigma regulatory factor (Ser/Thr protein kinase)